MIPASVVKYVAEAIARGENRDYCAAFATWGLSPRMRREIKAYIRDSYDLAERTAALKVGAS